MSFGGGGARYCYDARVSLNSERLTPLTLGQTVIDDRNSQGQLAIEVDGDRPDLNVEAVAVFVRPGCPDAVPLVWFSIAPFLNMEDEKVRGVGGFGAIAFAIVCHCFLSFGSWGHACRGLSGVALGALV